MPKGGSTRGVVPIHRFVRRGPNPSDVVLCGAGETPCGVSASAVGGLPAAGGGRSILVAVEGDDAGAKLYLAANANQGDRLKSAALGMGTPAGAGESAYAEALATGTAGTAIPVRVLHGQDFGR